jgi:hypothetical protein
MILYKSAKRPSNTAWRERPPKFTWTGCITVLVFIAIIVIFIILDSKGII